MMIYHSDIHVRQGGFLPHWTKSGARYHLRLRLCDSVPQHVLQQWREEKNELNEILKNGKGLQRADKERFEFLQSKVVEDFLDAGYGECWLQNKKIASIVRDAIECFDDDRYKLFAWCIMPNHVHVVVEPIAKEIHEIVHSWKSFTALKANKVLGRGGDFWQREYFDYLIRNQEDFERVMEYVWRNPDVVGLRDWIWRWRLNDAVEST